MTEYRNAIGIDSHRFDEGGDGDGTQIMLGGIAIPHTEKLAAHSDGDVVLHALTDALFGLIAAGDIGMHFPPGDPQWRDAKSSVFLRAALGMLREHNGETTFADITIIAEAPAIAPHRDAIRASIAALLGMDENRISVKATTAEGMGLIGRGEGIAAFVSVTARFDSGAPHA